MTRSKREGIGKVDALPDHRLDPTFAPDVHQVPERSGSGRISPFHDKGMVDRC
jgi:hypothetical protein